VLATSTVSPVLHHRGRPEPQRLGDAAFAPHSGTVR
jgi:hypothetical protein